MAGVVVLGSHRGGTSAVTEALAALGLYAGAQSGLKAGSAANERGFWEVTALTRFNDRLLSELGAAWDAPPAPASNPSLAPGWAAEAEGLFQSVFAQSPWVWKDPRTSVLFRFWRPLLEERLAVVIPFRHPAEVAQSLYRRDGMPPKLGLALWEGYLRAAIEGAAGLPTLVVPYSSLLEEPGEWQTRSAAFLADAHVAPPSAGGGAWGEVVDVRLYRERDSVAPEFEPSQSQVELLRLFESLTGAHLPLSGLELPQETRGTQDLFEVCSYARRVSSVELGDRASAELRTLRKRLDQLTSSLSWRVTAPLRRALRLASGSRTRSSG